MRANSRVFAFKVIFAHLFGSDAAETEKVVLEEEKLSEKELNFANEIVGAFMENRYHISKEIDEMLERYHQDRLYKVDLALIYLAMAELKCLNTPKAVVINEILEIAKKYSTEQSQKFINGVLAKTK